MPLHPWEAEHKYCTCVSPTAVKGLGVLLRLAMELPHVPFLAVQTAWTKPADLLSLWMHTKEQANVTVVSAAPDFTELLRCTKCLLVPSLWREPFGLVAIEAALLGIPVLSTAEGGLAEANPIRELRVPSSLFADFNRRRIYTDVTADEFETLQMDGAPELEEVERQSPAEIVSAAALCALAANDLQKDPVAAARFPRGAFTMAAYTAHMGASKGLDALFPTDMFEGGWHGPAPSAAAPVPGMKAKLQCLYANDQSYLKQMSQRAYVKSHDYLKARKGRLMRTLRQILAQHAAD